MQKIAFLVGSGGWGGLEMNVIQLAQWMKEKNWEVTFITREGTKIADRTRVLGFPLKFVHHRKYFDVQEAYSLSKVLKKSGIDKLMVFDNHDLDLVFFTKLFLNNLRVVYQQHMQIGIRKKDWLHTIRFSAIDWWISPLKKLKNEVVDKTNFNPSKIKVIPLGVEISKFIGQKQSVRTARTKLQLPQDDLCIGILGRIDPKKGQLFLVKAVQQLMQEGYQISLLIMGEATVNDPSAADYFNEIKQYIALNNLTNHIHFRPFSSEIDVFFQAIDVFASASESETYGMVTIEAMLAKKPVMAANTGGTVEILGEGSFGVLYNYEDLTDFKNKMIHLITDEKLRSKMVDAAYSEALENYSHHKEIDLIQNLLNSTADEVLAD